MAKKKGLQYYARLGFLSSDSVFRNLFFVLFIGFLAIVYIANAHYAERNVRRIQVLQKELKELRWYYMSLESENMFNSKQSEVANRVKGEGLRLHRAKPKKIVVDKDKYDN